MADLRRLNFVQYRPTWTLSAVTRTASNNSTVYLRALPSLKQVMA
jgi:hypothetical protein